MLLDVEMTVMLEKAKDAFALMCTTSGLKPKVVIELAELYLKLVKVNPAIVQAHAVQLNKEIPVIYPYHRVSIEYYPMHEKDLQFRKEGLFHGIVPKYIVMVLCSNLAFHGELSKNSFNFKHYNVKSVSLRKDRSIVPYEDFTPNFKEKSCLMEYLPLFQSNGLFGNDVTLPIT